MRIFVLFLFVCGTIVFAHAGFCTDYYIDASGGSNTNPGTESLPWKDTFLIQSHATPLEPGDHVKFKRGEEWSQGYLVMDYSGSAGLPIVYEAYGVGPKPKIVNYGIDFNGQKHVVVKDFEINGNLINGGYGIGLPAGTEYVEVRDCDIHHKGLDHLSLAVWIEGGPSALCNNRIINNRIHHNYGSGIGSDAFCLPGQENLIANNGVDNNRHHGVELNGKRHIIEGNTLSANGDAAYVTARGNSGIHLISNGSPGQGDYNIIRNNIVSNTIERAETGADGNGILMDSWCDDNQIYNNIAFNNDGPGIVIFGGSRNKVFNNTLYNNGLNEGYHVAKAQLAVLDAVYPDAAVSCSVPEGCPASHDNLIRNNIAYSTQVDNFSILVDIPSTRQNNQFSHNLWFNNKSNKIAAIADRDLDPPHLGIPSLLLSQWNAFAWADDKFGDPLFYATLSYDFRVPDNSPAIDAGIDLASYGIVYDITGNIRPRGPAFDIGAYEMVTAKSFSFLRAVTSLLLEKGQ